jgi:hypothetical protein
MSGNKNVDLRIFASIVGVVAIIIINVVTEMSIFDAKND